MRRARALAGWLLVLALAGPPRAGAADEVPLVGRPADLPFSGASAGFAVGPGPEYRVPFSVEATAAPAEVEELAPVTLTVTVRAAGAVRLPPGRIDLRQVPAFSRSFHIEDVTDGKKRESSPSAWRLTYRLRPRSPRVGGVPGVPFVFYNPDLRPSEKAFQVIWTDPLPLRVVPAERHMSPVKAPAAALELAPARAVLAAGPPWQGPGPALAAAALAAPPLACAAWLLAWRRLYPDAGRLTRQRRSRAARRALRGLEGAARERGRARAEQVARALAGYLQERFELHSAEPTPAEASAWLAGQGLPAGLAGRAEELLAACAEGRFRPGEGEEADLVDAAGTWVVAVEEGSCPPSS
jgi:hypothetical protein